MDQDLRGSRTDFNPHLPQEMTQLKMPQLFELPYDFNPHLPQEMTHHVHDRGVLCILISIHISRRR